MLWLDFLPELNGGLFIFLHYLTGSDFIKTSTGKESVNATYPVAVVMVRAIRDYFLRTGHKVSNSLGPWKHCITSPEYIISL